MTQSSRTGATPQESNDPHLTLHGDAGCEDALAMMLQRAAAFEHCAHGIALGQPGSNRIIACNRAFASMLGGTADEISGRPILSVYAPEEHERVLQCIAEADRVGKVRYESRLVRMDGSTIPAQMDVVTVRDESGTVLYRVATAQDITERRQAEEAQRKSEERLKFALETNELGAWSLDPVTRAATRTLGHARIFGYDSIDAEWGLDQFLAHVVPADRERVRQAVQGMLHTTENWSFECRIRRADGAERWILVSGGLERDTATGSSRTVYGITEDITERKAVEQSLAETGHFLQKLADSVPAAVAYWLPDLTCLFANIQAHKWYGWQPGLLKGKSVREFLGEERYLGSREYLEGVLQGRPQRFERELVMGDGTVINAWVQYIPDMTNGVIQGFFVLVSDVTEVKRAQKAQGELAVQLQQAQKMEVIGRLAGGMAHDFNNKLMVILGFAELAQINKDSPPHLLEQYLDQIALAARHSRDITMQLLAFSRQQVVTPQVIDPNGCIRDALKSLGRMIGENISCRLEAGEGTWPILVDPAQFDQIIMNMAINARDAMPDGGEFRILTDNVAAEALPCELMYPLEPGDYVRVSFCDSGSGIDEDTLPHIFEPFFTTKDSGKGTGLGLATIYGIVMQNQGGIHVSTTPGRGTRFDVYFPRRDNVAAPAAASDEAMIKGSGTVLVVEDEAAVRSVSARYLRKLGYQTVEAATPTEALTVAADVTVGLDLVLTDVVLPEMSGVKLAQQICALRPGLPVIFATGYAGDHDELAQLGSDRVVLQKPFDLKRLSDALKAQSGRSPAKCGDGA